MQNTTDIKRNIFDLFLFARILFNEYYDGFDQDYRNDDRNVIQSLINQIEKDIENIKELL